jgi:hypothetical protein
MSPLQKLIEQDEKKAEELLNANDAAIERCRAMWQSFLDNWHKPSILQFERVPDEEILP